ncbi:ABC transporter permease [Salipiger abyssi]|uniref:ABC transporter permease n=1 Tax=Salipiger abyssi TaxID=1250539 RepID=UPI001A9086CD|nr:ABC transporter permease [Salipiger abyssi]MBN9887216.1 ABC transporter permease [Salipiger abyssi]
MKLLVILVNRLAWLIPTVFGLMAITFAITHIIPADPVAAVIGENASPEQVAALKEKLGLDKPLVEQFVIYLTGLLRGDFGISLYTQRPISEDLFARVPATIELSVVTLFVAIAAGIPVGVISAVHRNSLLDHALRIFTVSGLAIASFWLAILFQLFFSMYLGWTPLQGRVDGWGPDPITGFFIVDALIIGDFEMLGDVLAHMVLPVLTMAYPAMATIVRFTRAGVLEAISSNFVMYESAMGFPRRVIIWKYVLRSALIGTVTQIGLIFGILIANSVVVETVFDWPGIGRYAVDSILNSDYNGVMGFAVFTGVIFILINALVDILHGLIDPRETR